MTMIRNARLATDVLASFEAAIRRPFPNPGRLRAIAAYYLLREAALSHFNPEAEAVIRAKLSTLDCETQRICVVNLSHFLTLERCLSFRRELVHPRGQDIGEYTVEAHACWRYTYSLIQQSLAP